MSEERLVYIDGELVPESAATISIFDVGLMYGVTIYESLRTFKHRWFQVDAHWKRLAQSLKYAGLDGLIRATDFKDALAKTLEANLHLT